MIKYMTLGAALLLASCATSNGINQVSTRSTFDLDCPADQVQVDTISERTYSAIGCGKRATYTTNRCYTGDLAGCTATLEGVTDD